MCVSTGSMPVTTFPFLLSMRTSMTSILLADKADSLADSMAGYGIIYPGSNHPFLGMGPNAPALAERPFSNFRNVAAHMRVRANLTGKEYAKLMEFLRRWHDVPPPEGPLEPGPKRFIFSQPIAELRKQAPAKQAASFDQPGDAAAQSAGTAGPPPGL